MICIIDAAKKGDVLRCFRSPEREVTNFDKSLNVGRKILIGDKEENGDRIFADDEKDVGSE